jgi:adenosylmethionine-8-amino-7-oxononanoate aminotransferase
VCFGRTGRLFACEHENVAPDFLCVAKGITGGYLPLAATLTTEAIYSAFVGTVEDPRTFYHGHTYCGNPLGVAAALACLDVFDEEQTLAGLPSKVDALADALAGLAQHRHVGEIRQRGLMAGIELVAERATRTPFPPTQRVGARVCLAARGHGVILRPLGDVLVLMPPLAMTVDQIRQVVAAVERALGEVLPPGEADAP